MLSVVLDTNIIVSGIISSKGSPNKILNLWRQKKIQLIISPAIIKEIIAVFKRPKIRNNYQLSDKHINKIKQLLQKDATLIKPKSYLKIIKVDPADDKFINCALTARVKFIVSGDKHLLDLKKYKKVKIIKAAEFLKLIK